MSVFDEGIFLGRVRLDGGGHPRIVTVRDGKVVDITAKAAPTVRDICEMDDPAGYVRSAQGNVVAALDAVLEGRADGVTLLSPVDLQAIKASGVTFVVSLLERVIEEQAKGDRAGRGNLYQMPADGQRRAWGQCGAASDLDLEQSRARSGADRFVDWRNPRSDAGQ